MCTFFRLVVILNNSHDSKVHGANMGPIWGRQDPGGSHVGLMNFAIWDVFCKYDKPTLNTNVIITGIVGILLPIKM